MPYHGGGMKKKVKKKKKKKVKKLKKKKQMRYLDAYELISTSLMANNLPFPVTEPLVARFFDDHVINVALRCNRKTNKEVLSVSGTSAAFTNTDIQAKKFTSQIFKVEKTNSDGTLGAVPFVRGQCMHDAQPARAPPKHGVLVLELVLVLVE